MSDIIFVILKEISGVPESFQILPNGEFEMEGSGKGILDAESAALVIKEFSRRGNDMVIDYEHQTLKGEEAPAAGWIKKLEYRGAEGLWGITDWTEKAKSYIVNREYRYFSPVILISKSTRKVISLINVALTNSPRINHLQPIIAKLDQLSGRGKNKNTDLREEEVMIEKLKKMFQLAADATEEKILEAVQAIVNKASDLERKLGETVACKEVLVALGLNEDAKKDAVLAIVASMKAPTDVAKQLSLEVVELKSKIAAMEQQDLVALALKDGKTSPEELDKWGRDLALKNPEQFKLIVLSRPAGSVIPVDGINHKKETPGGTLDDTQREVNRQMGIDEETYKKYNK